MDNLMFEIFEDLPRQGPGDYESTKKAFLMLEGLPKDPEILDVGCGVGKQTLALAGLISGRIIAVDNHEPFLAQLREKVRSGKYDAVVQTHQGDMAALDFPAGSFDVIWSEGAAYIMGFANALEKWRPLLRPAGSMVISEIVWFEKEPPREVSEYWANEVPDMKYFEDNFPVIARAGYSVVGYFPLPSESWWSDYYHPLEKKLAEMRTTYRDDTEAQGLLDSFQTEMEMHRKYSPYFGYGFYVMRRND
jgi:SAM-dependent methyltransferase